MSRTSGPKAAFFFFIELRIQRGAATLMESATRRGKRPAEHGAANGDDQTEAEQLKVRDRTERFESLTRARREARSTS